MRGAKAKQLRRIAEQSTTGAPLAQYVRVRHSGQIMLHGGCTRAFYQRMKKAERMAKHG